MDINGQSLRAALADSTEVIKDVDRADQDLARALIASAVKDACQRWIPVYVVSEALVSELMALLDDHASAERAATLLRAFADILDRQSTSSGFN